MDEKNVKMLSRMKVYTLDELKSRRDINLENYTKTIIIEANTMVDMARTQIAPAIENYLSDVAKAAMNKKAIVPTLKCSYETKLIEELSYLIDEITANLERLENAICKVKGVEDIIEQSKMVRDTLIPLMSELRMPCDKAEMMTERSYWPFPVYSDLLFGVK